MSETMVKAGDLATGETPAWLRIAERELGVHEYDGPRSNPSIDAYYRDSGHPEVRDDEVPWCAAFVGACLKRAGKAGSGSLRARSYLTWGARIALPKPGAVAVLSRCNDPNQGHVGFWLGTDGDEITLLGGNQGDAVSRMSFPASRVLGYRWPDADAADRTRRTTKETFEAALRHVLAMEGGWSDDPFDRGGPTNMGITLAELAEYLKLESTPENLEQLRRQLKQIEPALVRSIYEARYWRPACCARLPAPVALMHFDAAVNQGVGTAARMLQEAVRVEIDGEIGPITLAAAEATEPLMVVRRYAEIRMARYRKLSTFWRFGRGWLRRVDATLDAAHELIGQMDPNEKPQARTKEAPMTNEPVQNNPDQSKWWGQSLTIWGAIVTTLATVLPSILQAFGIDLPGELIRALGEQLGRLVQATAGVAGVLMTILGRVRARQPLQRRDVTMRF